MLPDYEQIAKALEVNVQTCDTCACRYVEWWANEELWAQVVGSYEGLLCLDCFRIRCWQNGIATAVIGYDTKGERLTETMPENDE